MARFELNANAHPTVAAQQPERVRIGAVSLLALVVVICLAVLSVLALSTANASLTMSQRQALAIHELYQDETAAQEFLAGVDDILAAARQGQAGQKSAAADAPIEFARDSFGNVVHDEHGYQVLVEQEAGKSDAGRTGLRNVRAALASLCESARQAAGGEVDVTASVDDDKVAAQFACENGRKLDIVITVRNDGTYRIDRWKMAAVQNEEEPPGQLLILD